MSVVQKAKEIFKSTAEFLQAVTMRSDLTVEGNLSVTGDINVSGDTNFTNAVVAAVGSSASDAAVLSAVINVVTGADGTKGVALPAAADQDMVVVINDSATAGLKVYPVNGGNDNINGEAEDAAVVLGPGQSAIFEATSATQWYTPKAALVTATPAEISNVASVPASIDVVAANGGANTVDVTITVKDADGNAIAAEQLIEVWLSDLADGSGGSAHTHSTGPAFTTGLEVAELIANDHWKVLTDVNGVAVLQLVDTANEDVTVNAAAGGAFGQDTTVVGDWSA